eukprot:1158581-Pelagomonas_calceolata.AAC.4
MPGTQKNNCSPHVWIALKTHIYVFPEYPSCMASMYLLSRLDDNRPRNHSSRITRVTRGLAYSLRLWLIGCCNGLQISYSVKARQERPGTKVCGWKPGKIM